MLFSNPLLLVGVAVSSVAARSIREFLHPQLPSLHPAGSHSLAPTPAAQEQCAFNPHPHTPHRLPEDPSRIPASAWPHITSLLSSHSQIRQRLTAPQTSGKQNLMQTIDLGATFAEGALEGVVLGVVYTASDLKVPAPVPDVGMEGREGRKGKTMSVKDTEKGVEEKIRKESAAKMLGCFDDAVMKVGERRQMEGELEFERGRISFLVYRID